MSWERTLEFVREATASGLRLHPQFTTNELGLHLKLADTFIFDEMPAWRAALTAAEPERSRRLRDDGMRDRLAAEFGESGRAAACSGGVLGGAAGRAGGHAR